MSYSDVLVDRKCRKRILKDFLPVNGILMKELDNTIKASMNLYMYLEISAISNIKNDNQKTFERHLWTKNITFVKTNKKNPFFSCAIIKIYKDEFVVYSIACFCKPEVTDFIKLMGIETKAFFQRKHRLIAYLQLIHTIY